MSEAEDREKIVLETMVSAGKPLKAGEIAEITGIPKDAVTKAIKALQKKGTVVSPKNCFYAPSGS